MTGGSSGGRLEGDAVSESFELGDEAAGGAFGVAAAVVVAAEVAVELAGCEHVPAGAEDRVLDRAERAAVATPRAEPLVLGGEVDIARWPTVAARHCRLAAKRFGADSLSA